MRLTNQMRDDFIDTVMSKVRRRAKWTPEKIRDEAAKRLREVLPECIKQALKECPDMVHLTSLDGRALLGHEEWGKRRVSCVNGQELTEIDTTDLAKGYETYLKEKHKLDEMRCRLRDVTYSCNTTQTLAKALPDLVDFIPKEPAKVVPASLPVTASGLYDDLVKMGFSNKKED